MERYFRIFDEIAHKPNPTCFSHKNIYSLALYSKNKNIKSRIFYPFPSPPHSSLLATTTKSIPTRTTCTHPPHDIGGTTYDAKGRLPEVCTTQSIHASVRCATYPTPYAPSPQTGESAALSAPASIASGMAGATKRSATIDTTDTWPKSMATIGSVAMIAESVMATESLIPMNHGHHRRRWSIRGPRATTPTRARHESWRLGSRARASGSMRAKRQTTPTSTGIMRIRRPPAKTR